MKLNYKWLLLLLVLLSMGTFLIYETYALWTKSYEGQENILNVGCFDISAEEINKPISLNNTYPMSDKKGLTQIPYKLKITNTCNTSASYTITLNTLLSSTMDKSKIKFAFGMEGSTFTSGINLSDYASNKEHINTDRAYLETNEILGSNLDESFILTTGRLNNENDSVTYELYLWIDQTAGNEVQGQKFLASVNAIASATEVEDALAKDLISFDMEEAVNGIKVKSNGDGTYVINGTSTNQVNIRLSDYFAAGTEGFNIVGDSKPNDKVIMEKGKTYRIYFSYISGSNTVTEFNTFRFCFTEPSSTAGLQTFAYDFNYGFIGSEHLVQDIGMFMIWIHKGLTFDNYTFRLEVKEVTDNTDDVGEISDVQSLNYNGTSMTAVWYDTGIMEIFGVNDVKVTTTTTYIDLVNHKMGKTLNEIYHEENAQNPMFKTGDNIKLSYELLKNYPEIDTSANYKYQMYFEFRDTLSSSTSAVNVPSLNSETGDISKEGLVTTTGTLKKDVSFPILIIGEKVSIPKAWRFRYTYEKIDD